MARTGRRSRGRQRVEMVKMKNESNLQVTFSKRRAGLFKKANELVTLCGAEVALIVFSPGGKVFSYGHPNVETIIERYLNRTSPHPYTDAERLVEARRVATVQELNDEVARIEELLDYAKQHARVIDMRWKNSPIKHWLEASIDDLNTEQLRDLGAALEYLQKDIKERKLIVQSASTNPYRLDLGLIGGDFAAYAAFNLKVPFAVREGAALNNVLSHNHRTYGASSSSISPGFNVATILPCHFRASAGAGSSSISPGFDFTAMLSRTSGAPSSCTVSHGFDIAPMPPRNFMASGAGSSSIAHEFDISSILPRASEVGSSTISHGFDLGNDHGNV